MNCTFCGNENPVHANFCWSCGAPLDLKACPQCEWLNEQAATHCSKCATALESKVTEPIELAGFSTPPKTAEPPSRSGPSPTPSERESLQSLLAQLKDDVTRLTATRAALEAIPVAEPASHAPPMLTRLPEVRRDPVVLTPIATWGRNWYVPLLVIALAAVAAFGYYAYQHKRETPSAVVGTIAAPATPAPSTAQTPAPPTAAGTVTTVLPPTAAHAGGEAASPVQHPPTATTPSKEAVEEPTPVAGPKRSERRTPPPATAETAILPAAAPPVARTFNTQPEPAPTAVIAPSSEKPASSAPVPCTEAVRAMGLCDAPPKEKNSSIEEKK